ncbi:uncharacterized protein TNIN_50401 [Trichonephila inaurata madagascariensis]|uniref:Uncharacterized protein n=1 Tax=Trichonephila inaurata madagascariensis TaxID=2747483 RepID=A0A8X6WWU5_9ARAC|nr:uncharacterized protein TNIN_50401 [Trichonephila inaurata madagascariensis]
MHKRLLPGFPVIASTSGLIRMTVKISVFIVSLCGFLYQTSEFLELYRAYPTMVDIKVENPDVVPLPAITIELSENFVLEEKFFYHLSGITAEHSTVNRANPGHCRWFGNRTQFCWLNPKYCSPEISDEEMVLAMPKPKWYNASRNTEDLEIYGMRRSDLLGECRVQTQKGEFPCKNFKSIVAPDENGFPNLCVAIESLWGQPDTKEEQIPVTTEISMTLKMKPEENIIYFDLVMGHILLHDAHSLGNPMNEGIALEAGNTYDLFVNKPFFALAMICNLRNNKIALGVALTVHDWEDAAVLCEFSFVPMNSSRVTTRLPSPYNTNCTDYLRLWRQNGGQGPLTERSSNVISLQACADKCKMDMMIEIYGCVGQSIPYPNNNSVCEDSSLYPSLEILKKCSKQCSEACEEVSYSLRTEVLFDHHEKSVSMFSYIGGYMGMWLGISLISLFDFLETLVSLCIYPLRNSKKFKKKSIQKSFDI